MTKTINIRNAPANWQTNYNYVYIGRAGKGLSGYFGNPIVVNLKCPICHAVHHEGGSTLICYERYLLNRLTSDLEFNKRFWTELKDKIQVCFCKPKPCHGDVNAKYLNHNDGGLF